MAQTDQILAALQGGERLTQWGAATSFGCWRLGARIHDLRSAGHDIITDLISLPNGKHIAEYRLNIPT